MLRRRTTGTSRDVVFLAIHEDMLLLLIMDIIEDAGTSGAFQSQTTYMVRNAGLDSDRGPGGDGED